VDNRLIRYVNAFEKNGSITIITGAKVAMGAILMAKNPSGRRPHMLLFLMIFFVTAK